MQLPYLIPLLAILTAVQCVTIDFINPGPAGPDSEYNDDPSFGFGDNIDVQWTPTSKTISLVTYQQTQNALFEYVFQNQKVPSGSYNWDITTNKSLSVSRIFFFEIFIEGQTGPVAVSHYFNITGGPSNSRSSSSSQTSTTQSTAASTAASTAVGGTTTQAPSSTGTGWDAAASATSTSSTTPLPSPSSSSDGLSLGAKVAIGVAIPVAAIAGIVAGWFFFGRKRRSNQSNEIPPQSQNSAQWHDPAQQNQTQWHPAMQSYYKPQNEVYAHYKQPPGEMESPHQGPVYNPQELSGQPMHSPAELSTDRHK